MDAPLYVKALASDSNKEFRMNFQQVKPDCCDVFVWVAVWRAGQLLSRQAVNGSAYEFRLANREQSFSVCLRSFIADTFRLIQSSA